MSRIRGANTKPELRLRRLLHGMGLRYRLHRRDLPGKPDIVFPSAKTVVFVHGCYWHRHEGCRLTTTPKTNVEFWQTKFDANVRRDASARAELERLGWAVITVWECETRDDTLLREAVHRVASAVRSGQVRNEK